MIRSKYSGFLVSSGSFGESRQRKQCPLFVWDAKKEKKWRVGLGREGHFDRTKKEKHKLQKRLIKRKHEEQGVTVLSTQVTADDEC